MPHRLRAISGSDRRHRISTRVICHLRLLFSCCNCFRPCISGVRDSHGNDCWSCFGGSGLADKPFLCAKPKSVAPGCHRRTGRLRRYGALDGRNKPWLQILDPLLGGVSEFWSNRRTCVRNNNGPVFSEVLLTPAGNHLGITARSRPSRQSATTMSADAVRELLVFVLGQANFPGSNALRVQASEVEIVGGPVTMMDLRVPDHSPVSLLVDGVVPLSTQVVDDHERPLDELLVWVTGGRLSCLEYAWWTDDPPCRLPRRDQVRSVRK